MVRNNAHYIWIGYRTSSSTPVVRLELQCTGPSGSSCPTTGTYQIRGNIRNDSNGWTNTSWFTISDAPHYVEFDWKASTAQGANNGYLTLWIDGTQQANLTGVDNDTRKIDLIRWGAVDGIDTGTRGTYYFDAFESRRSTYIGAAQSDLITATINYLYDPLYRLKEANYSDGRYFRYMYDAVGNRLTETKCPAIPCGTPTTNTYVYDIANRLTSVNGQTYTWDNNGNLLNDGTTTYTYDAANRLLGTQSSALSTSYTYNGLGDRISQTVDGATTNYTLDLSAGLTQVLSDGSNTYLYGAMRIGELQPGGWAYHLGDALGSVRQLADATGNVTLARNFEPYGNTLSSVGSGSTIYQYTGEIR